MEKNTLTFSNSGYAYDVDNPTQQTEELAYILKGALLGTSPLNIRQYDDDEFAEVYNRILDIADELGNIVTQLESIATIKDILAQMGGSDPESPPDWLQGLLSEVRDAIDNVQGILYVLTVYLKGETEEDPNLLQALDTIAASTGIFMDAPGLSIIDKPELL